MNYSTMVTLVTRNLGNRTDIASLVEEWINSTYLDIVTKGRLPELRRFGPLHIPDLEATTTFSTASDDADYLYSAIASNILFPLALRDTTNDNPIRRRPLRWYARHKATSTGKPQRYVTFSKTIYLDPTPDDTYTIQIWYRKTVDIPILQAGADTPVIDELWHELIVLGATYRGAMSLRMVDADKWKMDAKDFIVSHSAQYSEEEEDADFGVTIRM